MKYLMVLLLLFSFNSSAAICVSEFSDTSIVTNQTPVGECQSYVLLTSEDYEMMVVGTEVTAAKIMTAFTFGFGTYASFWFLGFKARMARQALKLV